MSVEAPERIWVERDPDTGEKRWFSIKGMGDTEYVRADKLEELAERAHYAEGVAFLAMQRLGKAEAALAEAKRENEALREWRPISDAPKEFREILAIDDETGVMHVTWFEHGQWHDPDRHYYSEAPDFVPTRWLPITPPHSLEVARNAGGNDAE